MAQPRQSALRRRFDQFSKRYARLSENMLAERCRIEILARQVQHRVARTSRSLCAVAGEVRSSEGDGSPWPSHANINIHVSAFLSDLWQPHYGCVLGARCSPRCQFLHRRTKQPTAPPPGRLWVLLQPPI